MAALGDPARGLRVERFAELPDPVDEGVRRTAVDPQGDPAEECASVPDVGAASLTRPPGPAAGERYQGVWERSGAAGAGGRGGA